MSLELLPPHQRYKSFGYGDVLFLALDSEGYVSSEVRDNEPAWLEQALTDATDGVDDAAFMVAFFHIPPFSSCGDLGCIARKVVENPWVDREIVPRLERFGVNLVLVGHDKINEHTEVNGVHYFQVTTGTSPRQLGASNPNSIFAEADDRAMMLTGVLGCELSLQIVRPDGAELDAATLAGNCTDADNDGFNDRSDCDDGDPNINPGAREICGDSINQDCDGTDTPCAADTDAGASDAGEGAADATRTSMDPMLAVLGPTLRQADAAASRVIQAGLTGVAACGLLLLAFVAAVLTLPRRRLP